VGGNVASSLISFHKESYDEEIISNRGVGRWVHEHEWC
jgi:hypothetical protein